MKDRIAETLEPWKDVPDFDQLVVVVEDLMMNTLEGFKNELYDRIKDQFGMPKDASFDRETVYKYLSQTLNKQQ